MLTADDDNTDLQTVFTVKGEKAKPIVVTVLADGKELQMKVNMGASVTIISNKTFRELLGRGQEVEGGVHSSLTLLCQSSHQFFTGVRCDSGIR